MSNSNNLTKSSKLPALLALLSGGAFGAVMLVASAFAQEGSTTKNGAFTADQAARGKVVYEKSCANCHQPDFYQEKLPTYRDKTVAQLFEAVSTTMPADNVGSLLTSEYIDVLSYIFSITGSTPGKTELTTDNMEKIKIAM
jgi:mono/diheme cytochrome c family protein